MANGDEAAAAGMDVVPDIADRREGYDEINKTRDYLARHQTTGTHDASAISSGILSPSRLPDITPKQIVDSGISIYKPVGFDQFNCSHNLAVLGAASIGTALNVGAALVVGSTLNVVSAVGIGGSLGVNGPVTFPAARSGVGGGWTSLVIQDSSGTLGVAVSARKYKKNFKPAPLEELAAIGKAVVTDFDYRAAMGGGRDRALIADDLHELGLDFLVRYGPDAEIEGIHYDRIAVAVLGYAQSLEARITALEGMSS